MYHAAIGDEARESGASAAACLTGGGTPGAAGGAIDYRHAPPPRACLGEHVVMKRVSTGEMNDEGRADAAAESVLVPMQDESNSEEARRRDGSLGTSSLESRRQSTQSGGGRQYVAEGGGRHLKAEAERVKAELRQQKTRLEEAIRMPRGWWESGAAGADEGAGVFERLEDRWAAVCVQLQMVERRRGERAEKGT
jgi:hypothetical protein